jgi:hypothetical protein
VILKKIHKYQTSSKSVYLDPSCIKRTDGQTDSREDEQRDMTKLLVTFLNSASTPLTVTLLGIFSKNLYLIYEFCGDQSLHFSAESINFNEGEGGSKWRNS